jgi:hypothetical protein
MSRNIVLAIDFDGTWTRDPVFFREMVERAKAKGHTCVLVTGRSDEFESGSGQSGTYTVTGSVDSENSFGAVVRSEFTCEVVFAAGEAKTVRVTSLGQR